MVTSSRSTAVTVMLRGPSKDVINEVERNLQDALAVVRNVMLRPRLVPGGGALEMALAQVSTFSIPARVDVQSCAGDQREEQDGGGRAAMAVCGDGARVGGDSTDVGAELRRVHDSSINRVTCQTRAISRQLDIRHRRLQRADRGHAHTRHLGSDLRAVAGADSLSFDESFVMQVLKTAVETSVMLLRIDDIVSGTKKRDGGGAGGGGPTAEANN